MQTSTRNGNLPSGTTAKTGKIPKIKETTQLHLGCHKGDLGHVQSSVKRSQADLESQKHPNGYTPLFVSTLHGHQEVVKFLLSAKANPNAPTTTGITPLHQASAMGHETIMEVLINANANIEAKTPAGRTPLHEACFNTQANSVKVLIKNHAKLDTLTNGEEKASALLFAAVKGAIDIVKMLIDAKAPIDSKTIEWIMDNNNKNEQIKQIISTELANKKSNNPNDSNNLNSNPNTTITTSTQQSPQSQFESNNNLNSNPNTTNNKSSRQPPSQFESNNPNNPNSLSNKSSRQPPSRSESNNPNNPNSLNSNPNTTRNTSTQQPSPQPQLESIGSTPLKKREGIGVGDFSITAVDAEGFTLLHRAAEAGNVSLVAQLITLKADPEAKDRTWQNTPLFRAVLADKPAVVKQLIAANVDANAPNKDGVSPLYQACAVGSEAIIRALIDAKADVEHRSSYNQTPLHAACLNGRTAAVQILLERKVDPSAMTKSGVCALYMAAERGHTAIISLLVKSNANVDLPSADGITPLMRAAYKNQLPAVKLLVDLGASVEKRAMNKNAAMWAKQEGNTEVAEFLISQTPNPVTEIVGQGAGGLPTVDANLPKLQDFLERINQKLIMGKLETHSVSLDTLLKTDDSQFEELAKKLGLNLGQKLGLKNGVRELREHLRAQSTGLLVYEDNDASYILVQWNTPQDVLIVNVLRLKACCVLGCKLVEKPNISFSSTYQKEIRLTKWQALQAHCTELIELIDKTIRYDRVDYDPKPARRIPVVDYSLLDISPVSVGEGIQSSVYVVTWRAPGMSSSQQFVIKRPNKNSPESIKSLDQEAQVWRQIPPHPNVAHLAAIARGPTGTLEGLLTMYHPLGSLDRLKLFRLHEDDLLQSLRGLARGVMHIHSLGLVHRDIASRNVLVSANKEFILTDFGMSQFGNVLLNGDERLPWRSLAPEILRGRTEWATAKTKVQVFFTASTDMWAFGILVWELANAREAYSDIGNDTKAIQSGIEKGSINLDVTETCLAYPKLAPVLLGCLQRDPTLRPNAREVLLLLGDNLGKVNDKQHQYADSHYSKHYADAGSSGGASLAETSRTSTSTSTSSSTKSASATTTAATTMTATSATRRRRKR